MAEHRGRGARRASRIEHLPDLVQRGDQPHRVLVADGLRHLRMLGNLLLHRVEVSQGEFGIDGLDVRHRVDLARDVHHFRVLEAAHHVGDGVGLADVGEELVAQAFALRRAGDETGDVDEFDHCRHHLLRLLDAGDDLQPLVGHRDDADVRLDGAERIVLRRDAGLGERVEESGLADVRQADDAALHFLPNRDRRRPPDFSGSCFFS